jgi:hypothetical protein
MNKIQKPIRRINLVSCGNAIHFYGTTVSCFILAEYTEKTIKEHETIVLSWKDADIFDVILNPAEPNAKLCDALEEHARRIVSQ